MGAVVIIVVIALIVLFLIISNAKPESDSMSTGEQAKSKTSTSLPKSKKIDLEGVYFTEGGRQEAFAEVKEGDSVTVTFDYGNQYDKNALGVYTQTGKLLGYIPKGKHGIIKAFRTDPKRTAVIVSKTNGGSQWDKGIKIELVL